MDRRDELLRLLEVSEAPLTGAELARRFGVTRQVIVQDIAVLRARGAAVIATPRGYFQPKTAPHERSARAFRVLTIQHDPKDTERELLILVDAGVEILDVAVDHPLYGEFIANLMLTSRREVLEFTQRVRISGAPLLLTLADGVHRHTLAARTEAAIATAVAQLRSEGFAVLGLE